MSLTYAEGDLNVPEPTAAGTYMVTATLSNPNYQATPVSGRLTINQVVAGCHLARSRRDHGGHSPRVVATDDAFTSVAGSFAYSPDIGKVLGVGNHQTLSVTFFPTDSVDFQQVTKTTTIDVLPNLATTAVIQFATQSFSADITGGAAQVVLSRTGSLAAAVTVVLSSPGGTDMAAFQQTITVLAGANSATVSIPLINDGRPDEADDAITLVLSAPGTGAALGTLTGATLTVHDTNPLPKPVTITALDLVKMRLPVAIAHAKTGNARTKTKLETVIQLIFSGDVSGAGQLSAYKLFLGKTKKRSTVFKTPVPLASAAYTSSNRTVTLIPAGKLNLCAQSGYRSLQRRSPTFTAAHSMATATEIPAETSARYLKTAA